MEKEKKSIDSPIIESKAIEEMTPEERNAEAEELEKTAKENNVVIEKKPLYDENDPLDKGSFRRLEKARTLVKKEEIQKPSNKSEEIEENKLSTDDYIILDKKGYSKDSAEAKLLKERKDQGVITDYRNGIEQTGVKAELDALKAKETAAAIVDDIDGDDPTLTTKQDVVTKFKTTGEVPDDKEHQEAIVDSNLKEMGF